MQRAYMEVENPGSSQDLGGWNPCHPVGVGEVPKLHDYELGLILAPTVGMGPKWTNESWLTDDVNAWIMISLFFLKLYNTITKLVSNFEPNWFIRVLFYFIWIIVSIFMIQEKD